MARIGYIKLDIPGQRSAEDESYISTAGCDMICRERFCNEHVKPVWKEMIRILETGDEVFLLSMENAFSGVRQLCLFLELCRVKRIRVVFMRDKIDSWEEMYQNSTANILNAIASLSKETYAIRRKRVTLKRNKTERSSIKKNRNEKCVELYQAGIPTEEIKKQCGFRSKSSVFRILRESGVKLNRRKWSNNE